MGKMISTIAITGLVIVLFFGMYVPTQASDTQKSDAELWINKMFDEYSAMQQQAPPVDEQLPPKKSRCERKVDKYQKLVDSDPTSVYYKWKLNSYKKLCAKESKERLKVLDLE